MPAISPLATSSRSRSSGNMMLGSSAPFDVSKCPGTKRIFLISVPLGMNRKERSLSLKGCMPSTYAPDVLTRAMRHSFRSRLRGVYGIQLRESSSIYSSKFFELFKQHRILRLVADRMDIDVSDDPFLVDDEESALGKALGPKHSKFQSG